MEQYAELPEFLKKIKFILMPESHLLMHHLTTLHIKGIRAFS